jgi:hypothetical protein
MNPTPEVFLLFQRDTFAPAKDAQSTRGALHLLRAGTFPASPADLTLTAADLDGMARAYDPARYMAPVVIGHPENDHPAHGWVHSLRTDAAGLWADVEILPELAAKIAAGQYRAVSAALWPPGATGNPSPGSWSLRHAGFLGAVPPAVKGLAPFAPNAKPKALPAIPDGRVMCERGAVTFRAVMAYLAEHPGVDVVTAAQRLEGFRYPPGYRVDPHSLAKHRAAVAYLSENPGVDFATAVQSLEGFRCPPDYVVAPR